MRGTVIKNMNYTYIKAAGLDLVGQTFVTVPGYDDYAIFDNPGIQQVLLSYYDAWHYAIIRGGMYTQSDCVKLLREV